MKSTLNRSYANSRNVIAVEDGGVYEGYIRLRMDYRVDLRSCLLSAQDVDDLCVMLQYYKKRLEGEISETTEK